MRGPPIRVLLCDDAGAFRTLLRHTLSQDPGIEVVGEAADGEEGVAQVQEMQPDVVLLDLSMPRLDGMAAIPLMRTCSPRTSIVALSSFGAERMAAPCLARGACAYLEKGSDAKTIRDAVHAAAAHA